MKHEEQVTCANCGAPMNVSEVPVISVTGGSEENDTPEEVLHFCSVACRIEYDVDVTRAYQATLVCT